MLKETRERKVIWELKVIREPKEILVLKVIWELKEIREHKALLALEPKEMREPKEI